MNLTTYLPVLSKIAGRDLSIELNLFYRVRASVGTTQDQAGQEFVMNNWRGLADFMESDEGQIATAAFIDAWRNPKVKDKPADAVAAPQAKVNAKS